MPLLCPLLDAGVLVMLLSAPMATIPAVAQPVSPQAPMEVTTDTAAYCQYLADRLHDLVQAAPAPPSHEVADLSTEGQHMCTVGQTRPGIMRLRLALMLITHKDDTLHNEPPRVH